MDRLLRIQRFRTLAALSSLLYAHLWRNRWCRCDGNRERIRHHNYTSQATPPWNIITKYKRYKHNFWRHKSFVFKYTVIYFGGLIIICCYFPLSTTRLYSSKKHLISRRRHWDLIQTTIRVRICCFHTLKCSATRRQGLSTTCGPICRRLFTLIPMEPWGQEATSPRNQQQPLQDTYLFKAVWIQHTVTKVTKQHNTILNADFYFWMLHKFN